ncbi:MAG: nitrophenyl compound nitroreductase subunit ArsF family protein [Limisphaerales bacterium]
MPGPEAMPAAAGADAADTHSVADQVIAYYFHGTVRCETCLTIEQRAKAVIEEQFGADLAAERMVFMPVDYDLPENARYLTDYSLPCPSLVLVRQADGKAGEWKLLGDTWQLVHEPFQLDHYVETEMRNFLRGPHLPAITTPLGRHPLRNPVEPWNNSSPASATPSKARPPSPWAPRSSGASSASSSAPAISPASRSSWVSSANKGR